MMQTTECFFLQPLEAKNAKKPRNTRNLWYEHSTEQSKEIGQKGTWWENATTGPNVPYELHGPLSNAHSEHRSLGSICVEHHKQVQTQMSSTSHPNKI